MDRRRFLTGLGAGAAASALPAGIARAAAPAGPEAFAAAFAAALKERPWLIGLMGTDRDATTDALPVEGRWPAELRGSFYRNGPGRHERGGMRYHHWFDGDGMVHRWAIADGRVDYRARFVRTPKLADEDKAGRFLYDAGGTAWPDAKGAGPDGLNVANTSVLPMGDAVWALWEGGSPYALDARTLETRGPVELAPGLKRAPFSAHPRVGQDGRVWNIGYLGTKLAFYRLDRSGNMEAFKAIDVDPVGMVHDFFLTERSVVVLLPSADQDGDDESYFGHIRARPDKPMQLIVADRDTLDVKRRAELPSGYWFHGGNAWEAADGTIRFDVSLLPDARIVQRFRAFMRGDTRRGGEDYATTTLFTVAPGGRVTAERIAGDGEFPRIDPRAATRRNAYVYTAAKRQANSHWYDSVRRVNVETGRVDAYDYGREFLVEEHVFVPRPGSTREGEGWLLGTALHWPSQRTCLNLLNAERLGDGPVARAWAPVPAPLGFHGAWMGA